jgi:hypothetical protein
VRTHSAGLDRRFDLGCQTPIELDGIAFKRAVGIPAGPDQEIRLLLKLVESADEQAS